MREKQYPMRQSRKGEPAYSDLAKKAKGLPVYFFPWFNAPIHVVLAASAKRRSKRCRLVFDSASEAESGIEIAEAVFSRFGLWPEFHKPHRTGYRTRNILEADLMVVPNGPDLDCANKAVRIAAEIVCISKAMGALDGSVGSSYLAKTSEVEIKKIWRSLFNEGTESRLPALRLCGQTLNDIYGGAMNVEFIIRNYSGYCGYLLDEMFVATKELAGHPSSKGLWKEEMDFGSFSWADKLTQVRLWQFRQFLDSVVRFPPPSGRG